MPVHEPAPRPPEIYVCGRCGYGISPAGWSGLPRCTMCVGRHWRLLVAARRTART